MTPDHHTSRRRGRRSRPGHLRPAESDARLAELLRDVNAPPTAAELRSPLALDTWRYNRSAHVAALRAAPTGRRAAARRHAPVSPLLTAATTVAVVALSMGGALWHGGTLATPWMVGVADRPSSLGAGAPSSPAALRRASTAIHAPAPRASAASMPGRSPAPSARSAAASPVGASPAGSSGGTVDTGSGSGPGGDAGGSVSGGIGVGGVPVTIAEHPGSGPTGAPPTQPIGSGPGAGAGTGGTGSAGADTTSTPTGAGGTTPSQGSTSVRTAHGDGHESHRASSSPATGQGATTAPAVTPSPSSTPCLGPRGQQLPPRACENLAAVVAASPGATPSS